MPDPSRQETARPGFGVQDDKLVAAQENLWFTSIRIGQAPLGAS
jgi:hypothetical protein